MPPIDSSRVKLDERFVLLKILHYPLLSGSKERKKLPLIRKNVTNFHKGAALFRLDRRTLIYNLLADKEERLNKKSSPQILHKPTKELTHESPKDNSDTNNISGILSSFKLNKKSQEHTKEKITLPLINKRTINYNKAPSEGLRRVYTVLKGKEVPEYVFRIHIRPKAHT